jgi:energy-converting hydrogenase Eha subunit F
MKKFFAVVLAVLVVLGALFAYLLYSEGAFDKAPPKSEAKPFGAAMKCEAGKCASGKCMGGK